MRLIGSFIGSVISVLALVACVQGGQQFDPARTVSGEALNWPGGTGIVQPVVTDETGATILRELDVTSPISEAGSFSLTLPATVDSELLSSEPLCAGTFEGSMNPGTWGEFFAEIVVRDGEDVLGGLVHATSPDIYFSPEVGDMLVFRLYVDRDVSVEGTCTEEGFVTEFDAHPEQGWNYVVFQVLEVDPDGFPTRVSLTTESTVPANVEWYFVSMEAPVE